MVGGVFLYLIAKRVVSPNAGLFSVFFYLFVPWSIFTSRAFMPDPLMVMLLLSSVLALLRYHEQPSTRRLLIAAVASSLAVFVKPVMCLFQIFGAFVSLAVYRQGVRRSLTSSHVLGFMVLSVLPTALYYLYGTFVAGFLQTTNTFTYRIVPHLLLEATFWVGWGETIAKVVGYSALAGALLGVLLLRRGVPRALMVGLWGGYLLFGLVFTTHISTHDYYSLQLIPVIALSLGPIWELVTSRPHWAVSSTRTGRGGLRKYTWGVVPALLVSALILGVVVENRQTILKIVEQERYAEERWAPRIATYQEIGQVVNHSRHTLVLVHWDYGNSLAYHGRLAKKAWPPPAQLQVEERLGRGRRSVEKRFDALSSEHPPEYFIITKNWYWDAEYQDLRGFLTKNFTLMAQGDDYVVFDLRDKG
jgi:4-amino-4-deoxy-L-arabinose transferase-like glycosyltransferase